MGDKLKSLSSLKILVAGDLMLDRYWFGDVSRISPEAPVPVVKIDKVEERLGGAGNVARNVSSIGPKCTLVSVSGLDDTAGKIDHLLEVDKIRNQIIKDPNVTTTIKLRVIGRQQQLIRLDFEDKPNDQVLKQSFSGFVSEVSESDTVILSDYGKGGLTDITEMINICNESGKPVIVDPKGSDFLRYKGATIITPNREELYMATGIKETDANLSEKMDKLCKELDFSAVLLTRSEKGMTLFQNNGEQFHVPALAQEVYDVSGAGDTVIAILGVMIANGESLREAVQWANKAAGLVVAKLGTAVVGVNELFGQGY